MSCTAFSSQQYWNEFTEPHQAVTVVRNGSIVQAPSYPGVDDGNGGWTRVANSGANTLTGYYSDKARCNGTPGLLPGIWKTPLVWESYCQNYGVKRELTMQSLYSGAMASDCNTFCNSITDLGGNPRKPEVCGGSDPNISDYNPGVVAGEEVQGQITELQNAASDVANEVINENRKKIFCSAIIIFLMIALLYLFIF